MSVMKFDKTPTPLEEVIKINEIIDNLGSGSGVGIRREEFTSSDWVEQQDGTYRYTIYGIKDVISVYRLYDGDYAFVGCDITNDDNNAYIDSSNVFDGFAYVADQEEEVLGNRNIGAIIKTLIPQNDAGLHLLDGSLIQGDGIYEDFVNYMAELYGDGTNIPNYFTSESNWQNEVITYGCCGKFVYDSENNTVRLPKFERILQGTLLESELGDRVEAGAPNITGRLYGYTNLGGDGALFEATQYESGGIDNSGAGNHIAIFDASKYNPIYGNSDTIQPPAIKVLYYIVITTSKKTDIEVDIDNIVNDLDRKADKDLSNTGCITNCLTSIPQDIKLELNDGTLTLKAGSKIYVPDGNDVFYTVIIPNDITIQGWSNVSGIILIDNIGSSYAFTDLSQCYSGASSPTIADGVVWYDTTNNIVKRCNDGSAWTSGYSLPIAIASSNNSNPGGISGIASLDQVFNGFGFIGSLAYVLPGVKGLIPYGRNEDGSLKNLECNITKVTTEQNNVKYSGHIAITSDYMDLAHSDWYNEIENQNYGINPTTSEIFKFNRCIAGDFVKGENGKIISLTPKTTFHAVDYNDISSLSSGIGFPDYSAGVSKSSNTEYTAESDGYIFAQVFHNASSGSTNIQVTINGSNIGFAPGATDYGRSQIYLPIKKGDVYKVVANDGIVFYPVRS